MVGGGVTVLTAAGIALFMPMMMKPKKKPSTPVA